MTGSLCPGPSRAGLRLKGPDTPNERPHGRKGFLADGPLPLPPTPLDPRDCLQGQLPRGDKACLGAWPQCLGGVASVPIILGRFLWPRKFFSFPSLLFWFGLVVFSCYSGRLLGPAVHTWLKCGTLWGLLTLGQA